MLTIDNIDKLKKLRQTMDQFLSDKQVYGKLVYLYKKYDDDIKNLGFSSHDEAVFFNVQMNFYEADNCYRVRMRSDNSIGLCDGCVGRSVPCQNVGCAIPLDHTKYIPESQMIIEQQNEAQRVGYEPLVLVHPEHLFYSQEYPKGNPDGCCMYFARITEPRWDIFYGMGHLAKAGKVLYNLIDEANRFQNVI